MPTRKKERLMKIKSNISNTNTNKKCFIVAFGAEHKSGRDDFEMTSLMHPILFNSETENWIAPYIENENIIAEKTNIPNVFFVKGNISENELSKFYREKIETVLSDKEYINEYKKEQVSLYVKEVSDDKDAMRF